MPGGLLGSRLEIRFKLMLGLGLRSVLGLGLFKGLGRIRARVTVEVIVVYLGAGPKLTVIPWLVQSVIFYPTGFLPTCDNARLQSQAHRSDKN